LESYRLIFITGQYFTILCLICMVYAFDLKLRFVLSVTGRYYEYAIQHQPERVTRWRDEFDRYILRSFFWNNKTSNRLAEFQHSTKKNDTNNQ